MMRSAAGRDSKTMDRETMDDGELLRAERRTMTSGPLARYGYGLALLLLLVSTVPLACSGGWTSGGKERTPTSVVWLGSKSTPLEASDVARLKEAGIEEAFVHLARFDAGAANPLVAVEMPDLPPSMPVTIVVAGGWKDSQDVAALAERVADAAQDIRFDVEGRGSIPVGLHFDFTKAESLGSLQEFLQALRDELDRSLLLSLSIQRPWLERQGVAELARSADYVVPFLYGQRVNEKEISEAWDFITLERYLQNVESWDVPYMLGVVSLGSASHLRSNGAVKARITPTSVQEILWNRGLKLRPSFSLDGVNRRVYEVVVEKSTRVGPWQVAPGEVIRIVRAATSDLEELLRLLEAWEVPHHLGQAYYRIPSPEEKLSLSLENLLNALDRTPAAPDLHLDASLQRRSGRGWLVRFSITNRNGEITELSLVDNNFLEVRCLNGVFGKADLEDFYRFDLYRRNKKGELERTFRRSDTLRLHIPILEGAQKVSSGDVEVHLNGRPVFELSGRFLLPDGRTIELGPSRWPAAGVTDEAGDG